LKLDPTWVRTLKCSAARSISVFEARPYLGTNFNMFCCAIEAEKKFQSLKLDTTWFVTFGWLAPRGEDSPI
jgi:hypothetical protein